MHEIRSAVNQTLWNSEVCVQPDNLHKRGTLLWLLKRFLKIAWNNTHLRSLFIFILNWSVEKSDFDEHCSSPRVLLEVPRVLHPKNTSSWESWNSHGAGKRSGPTTSLPDKNNCMEPTPLKYFLLCNWPIAKSRPRRSLGQTQGTLTRIHGSRHCQKLYPKRFFTTFGGLISSRNQKEGLHYAMEGDLQHLKIDNCDGE